MNSLTLTASSTSFDRSFGGQSGTVGSSLGRDIEGTTTTVGADGIATYAHNVAIAGNVPVGDLYNTIQIVFRNYSPGTESVFFADTDTLKLIPEPVPEPNTGFLSLTAAVIFLSGGRLLRRGGALRSPSITLVLSALKARAALVQSAGRNRH